MEFMIFTTFSYGFYDHFLCLRLQYLIWILPVANTNSVAEVPTHSQNVCRLPPNPSGRYFCPCLCGSVLSRLGDDRGRTTEHRVRVRYTSPSTDDSRPYFPFSTHTTRPPFYATQRCDGVIPSFLFVSGRLICVCDHDEPRDDTRQLYVN